MTEIVAQGAEAAVSGLTWGLVLAALLLGLRHGIDWDHIAAITDIAATQNSPRRGFRLGTMYVLGHAAVVLALGTVIILVGLALPEWVDAVMGKVVGVTLVALGIYVLISMIRDRGRFRPRSRWMILIGFARSLWARLTRTAVGLEHAHQHAAVSEAHHPSDDEWRAEVEASGRVHVPVHSHPHSHYGNPAEMGTGAAVGVGVLHGIGAETPTQVVLFLAAAGAGGVSAGLVVLVVFLVGLMVSNSIITLMTTFGFQRVADRARLYMAMGAVTAVFSLIVGAMLLFGQDTLLPALAG